MKYLIYGPSAWKQKLAGIFGEENQIKTKLFSFIVLLHVTFDRRQDDFAVTQKLI